MFQVDLCGKQMEKLPHYYFPWITLSKKKGGGINWLLKQVTEEKIEGLN
jgi:hypothetical protein